MMKSNLDKYIVNLEVPIKEAMKKLDKGGIGFIVCVDKNENVIGVVTDGDFRRAILQGIDLKNKIDEIANKNLCYLNFDYEEKEVKAIFESTGIRHIPILKNGKLFDILLEKDFFKSDEGTILKRPQLNLPVVIMAGGKGVRLDPFTRVLPKALIPIGEKPIIEIIIDKFAEYGMKNFYISVNHKAKMIKAFFEDQNSNYQITFIEESKPLGTAGALRFLERKFKSPFFVTNCDIIIETDYTKIYKFHTEKKYDLTLVASMQHRKIPYGVCEIENVGDLKSLKEKPEYDFLVNTGFYVLSPNILGFIPKNKCFDMTDFMKILKQKNKKIGVYPVSERSWIDVGEWTRYKESLKRLESY